MAMLYPTYRDLIAKTNENLSEGEDPIVKSRYSIVAAAAKRARQIVDDYPELIEAPDQKALSVAINELDTGVVRIERYREE